MDNRVGMDRVMSSTLVSHVSDISVVMVGVVLDVLNSAVREENTVAPLNIPVTVGSLSSVEVGPAVLVVDAVVVAVGMRSLLVDRGVVDRWRRGVVSRVVGNMVREGADQTHQGHDHHKELREDIFRSFLLLLTNDLCLPSCRADLSLQTDDQI